MAEKYTNIIRFLSRSPPLPTSQSMQKYDTFTIFSNLRFRKGQFPNVINFPQARAGFNASSFSYSQRHLPSTIFIGRYKFLGPPTVMLLSFLQFFKS